MTSPTRVCVLSGGAAVRPMLKVRGFSLIEVLIAIVVLAIGLLGLGAVFPVVVNQQRQVADSVQGMSIERSVAEMLRGNRLLSDRGDTSASFTMAADQRRGWHMLVGEPTWSAPTVKFPDGEWELAGPQGELTSLIGDLGYNPATGDMGVSPGAEYGVFIPLAERLIPRPYSVQSGAGSASEPRYVWDFAARRITSGARIDAQRDDNPTIAEKLADDRVQLAIFVRRIDPGIRKPSGKSLSDVLTGRNLDYPDTELRLPVAADADGRPTLDGRGIGARLNYSPIMAIRYELADAATADPRDVRLDRIIVDENVVNNPIQESIPVRAFVEQTGQIIVDQDGVVHTVKDVEVREANGQRQTGRVLVIEPPLSRETLLLTGEDRRRMTMLFTPQIPASVNVVIVGE